jgi:ankyrin repeat protein
MIDSQHKKTHEKPWVCPSCEKSFGLRADRDRHVKCKYEIGHAKFSCSFEGCEFRSTRKDNLMQHRRKRHGLISKLPRRNVAQTPQTLDRSTLMRAASTGRIDALELCLRSGLSINLKTDDGFTAVHCAARAGHADVLRYLLHCGADASAYSENGSPTLPVHEAILGRSLECFQLLLDANARIKSPDGNFKHVVDCIMSTGDMGLAQSFIDHQQGDADVRSAINALALAAAGGGQTLFIESLISTHPEEVQIATNSHQSPLYIAAKRGHTAIVGALLDLFQLRTNDNRALSTLKSMSLRPAAKRGYIGVVSLLLLPGGAPITSLWEATNVAVENNQFEVIRMLATSATDYGLDIDSGQALRMAIEHNHLQNVAHLSSLYTFDFRPGYYGSILGSAVQLHRWACVEILLSTDDRNVIVWTNPSVLHRVNDVGTALHLAIEHERVDAVALLLSTDTIDVNKSVRGENALQKAVKNGSLESLQLLLAKPSIDVNARFPDGSTILLQLLRKEKWPDLEGKLHDTIAHLLASHENIDTSICDAQGNGTLELAAHHGLWFTFEMLLNLEGPGPLLTWFSEQKAIEILLRRCNLDTSRPNRRSIQDLVRNDVVSVNARRPDGKTLLHHAAEHNEVDLVRVLVNDSKLDSDLRHMSYDFGHSKGHQTAMEIAKAQDYTEVVDLLG